jgi:pilus assembly protein CpaB
MATRQRRMWMVLGLALASGGLAAYLALNFLRTQQPLRVAQPSGAHVVVAAQDLKVGTTVRATDVRLVRWPESALPSGYVGAVDAVVGRGVITPVRINEPMLDGKLAAKGAGAGLQITIPEGMRAVSVKVDEVIGVAGFVLPRTRVDVIMTLPPTPGTGLKETTTRLFMQNVLALASGQVVQQDAEGKPLRVTVITLLVTPEQAEVLILAGSEGKIQLALRNTLDLDTVRTAGARADALLNGLRPGSGALASRGTVAGDPRTVIEAFRGGVRTLIKF